MSKTKPEIVPAGKAPKKKSTASMTLAREVRDLMNKAMGKGTLQIYGDGAPPPKVECISTGIAPLNKAIIGRSEGGLPRGRLVEIYGPEATSKTSLALGVIAEAQRDGSVCAFIDVEHALDTTYARDKIGVNVDELLLAQPDHGEQALELMMKLIETEAVDVIVLDSVAALVSLAELEGKGGQAAQARLMSTWLRKLTAVLRPSGPVVIFINQIRYKLGVMFGNPEITSGGNALKYYASIRIELKRIATHRVQVKREKEVIGFRLRAKVTKNKLIPPFKEVLLDVIYAEGVTAVPPKKDEKKPLKEKKGKSKPSVSIPDEADAALEALEEDGE